MSEEMKRLVREAITLNLKERDHVLAEQRAQVIFKFSRAGAMGSSRMAVEIRKLFADELKIRSRLIFASFSRVAGTLPPDDGGGIEAAVRSLLVPALEAECKKLERQLKEGPPFRSSGGSPGPSVPASLTEACDLASRTLKLEAKLMQSSSKKSSSDRASGTSVSINGDGNIVQAGLYGSSASIQLSAAGISKLTEALDEVRDTLEGLSTEASIQTEEIVDLIEEAKQECGKSAPNKTRLKALVTGVAGSIQTVASLQPAYHALLGALAYIGITM